MSESRMQSGAFVLLRLLWRRFPSSAFTCLGGWKEHVNPPPPVEHVALIRFVNHIHLEWEGEEVAAAASSEEHKGGKLIGRSVWGKALNIMLIAHPPQFAFCANYRKAKCEISFLSPPRRKVQYLLVPQGI